MNCLIVDENKMAREAMKHLASMVEDVTIVNECGNAVEACNFMQSQAVDVLFLNIERPDVTASALAQLSKENQPIIIFATSQKDYSPDVFDLNVADYLVKPITPRRFLQALSKAREIYESNKSPVSKSEKDFVFIRDNGILKRLQIEDIHFLEAMGDYVKVFTQQKFHSIHNTLRNVEKKLSPEKFVRVHRSFIVALNKVERIEEGVIVINNKPVPVGDAYRSALNRCLNIL